MSSVQTGATVKFLRCQAVVPGTACVGRPAC